LIWDSSPSRSTCSSRHSTIVRTRTVLSQK
jgi:hypothetical protein